MKSDEKTIDEVLKAFEDSVSPFEEHEISTAISEIDKALIESNLEEEFKSKSETLAFGFSGNPSTENSWGTYYAPRAIFQDEGGNLVEAPSIKSVTPKILEYWQKRAKESNNPFMKSRYADLVWDFTQKVTGMSPNYIFAQIVVDSSLELITRNRYVHEVNGIKKLKRALSVALSINDESRITSVRDRMIKFEDSIAKDSKPGLWGFCFDELLDNKNIPLSAGQKEKIITEIEKRLERTTRGETLDAHAAEIAAVRLAKYYRKWNQVEDFKRVLRQYGQAVIKNIEKIEPMAGSAWVEQLYALYIEYGMRDDANNLTTLIRELGEKAVKGMKTISGEFSISKDEMEEYLSTLTEGELIDVLTRIAWHFLPDSEDVKQQVIDLSTESPLTSFIPFTLVDWEGRPVAKIGPLEQDLEGRIVNQTAQNISFSSVFLRATIKKTMDKFAPSLEDITNYFFLSPIFSETYREIISIGLEAYLSGKHIISAHILIPQIENGIRQLLKLSAGPIYKQGRNGALYLRNLDELLRDENIVTILGEKVSNYLRTLLTDQRGWNLRNDVCHSTIHPDKFSWTMTDRILHALLLLAQVREKSKEGQE